MAKTTPIEPGVIARVVQGIRYTVTGKTPDWFGPQQPIAPAAQEQAAGRQFDYPVAFNTRFTPRSEEAISFPQMRALADGYDLLRLVIETRKDQMAKLQWVITPRDKTVSADGDQRIKMLSEFFRYPDKEHDWQTWLRMALEDLLVIDAPTLYPRMTKGGTPYAFEPMDGATIKRVLDQTGRTPLPPDPAYQQVLKGVPAVDYTRDQLVYRPRNQRTSRVYGYSPVEQVIMTVNIAIRRQIHQLQFYTEGNVPEMLFGVPETWNPDQILQFQNYFDSLMVGDTAQRRHAKFVPGGIKPMLTKESALKDEYDEWLARVVCYAFSVSPTPFIKQVNRATAASAQEAALQEGLAPIMSYVKDMIDYLIAKYFGFSDLEFTFSEEEAIDPLIQAQVNDLKVRNGTMTINEARDDGGMDPIDGGDVPMIYTGTGPVMLKDVLNPPDPPPVVVAPSEVQGKPVDKPVDASKLAKSARRLRKIDRNRPLARHNVQRLGKLIKAVFARDAKNAADQIGAALGELGKADREIVQKILSQLTLSGIAVTTDDIEKILEEMSKDGGAQALLQIGITDSGTTSQVDERAIEYAKNRAAEMVQIDDTTKEGLRSIVTKAVEEGWSTDDLSAAIADSYLFSDSRADMIARTEIAKADVAGNMSGYRESGVVTGKVWLLGSEHDIDDPCNDNADAGEIGIDDVFPSGDDAPPQHPNCVCDVVPVLSDNQNEDQ